VAVDWIHKGKRNYCEYHWRSLWEWALSGKRPRHQQRPFALVQHSESYQRQNRSHDAAGEACISTVDNGQLTWPHAVEIVKRDPGGDEEQPHA
jgi:hypothetical protein